MIDRHEFTGGFRQDLFGNRRRRCIEGQNKLVCINNWPASCQNLYSNYRPSEFYLAWRLYFAAVGKKYWGMPAHQIPRWITPFWNLSMVTFVATLRKIMERSNEPAITIKAIGILGISWSNLPLLLGMLGLVVFPPISGFFHIETHHFLVSPYLLMFVVQIFYIYNSSATPAFRRSGCSTNIFKAVCDSNTEASAWTSVALCLAHVQVHVHFQHAYIDLYPYGTIYI